MPAFFSQPGQSTDDANAVQNEAWHRHASEALKHSLGVLVLRELGWPCVAPAGALPTSTGYWQPLRVTQCMVYTLIREGPGRGWCRHPSLGDLDAWGISENPFPSRILSYMKPPTGVCHSQWSSERLLVWMIHFIRFAVDKSCGVELFVVE